MNLSKDKIIRVLPHVIDFVCYCVTSVTENSFLKLGIL